MRIFCAPSALILFAIDIPIPFSESRFMVEISRLPLAACRLPLAACRLPLAACRLPLAA
jgi:hypothetical protein